MRRPHAARLGQLYLALLLVGGLATAVARAAETSPEISPWQPLADRVFTPVAENADLPHALIPTTMTESANGFLFVGGDTGLLRWDGYTFRDYPAQPNLPDGLKDNGISTLFRDANGELWVGTMVSGLARYDTVQDRLVCVPLGSGGCGTQHIWSITNDGLGGVWVAHSDGLTHLDAARTPARQVEHVAGQTPGTRDDSDVVLLMDRRRVLWAGTKHGLLRSTDEGRSFHPIALGGSPGRSIGHLLEDSAGRLWVGTRQEGAYVVGADGGTATLVNMTGPSGVADTAPEITAFAEIAPNLIWIGTDGGGIVEIDAASMRSQRILHDPTMPSGLDSNSVQALFRDRSGLVWVGTENGLRQYNPSRFIMTLFGHQGRQDGLPGESVVSLLARPDGSLWAGLHGDGFAILDGSGRRAAGLSGHHVYGLSPSPSGGTLLGTDSGLYLADASGQHVTRLTIPHVSPKLYVQALRTVGDDVWLAAREGGVWRLRIDAGGRVALAPGQTGPLFGNMLVNDMGVAPGGKLAIGTDGGFYLLNLASGGVEHIKADPANERGLDSGMVDAFVTDRHGRLWVGTTNGLDILEGRDASGRPRFHRLGLQDGLPNAAIDSLLTDRQGMIWASTDKGLAVIDPDTLSVHALQRADGLAITNYWTASAAVTREGDLVFGGIGGFTVIHPEATLRWHYRPPVVFTSARINGKPAPVTQQPNGWLVLPPGASSLSVEFAALDFSAPARNRYRYRLDGLDFDWIDTDAQHREAAYTNLAPGIYRLRLLGSNRDGVWSEPETTLRIAVLPAWYQTVWFHLVVAAGAVLFVASLLRAWTSILRRRQRELERQVAERTGELSMSKLELQHANTALEKRVAERTQALAERTSALEVSEARFRAWFDHAEDAVFVVQVEPDGRFRYEAVNAAVERVFGVDAESCLGRTPGAVLPPGMAAAVVARFKEAAQGAPIQFEARVTTPIGNRLLDTWLVPLRNPVNGRVERLVGASRDITERHALEARLAQAQKLQALGGLAGGIAHDFNNILQAVAGAAALMEHRPEDRETIQRLARRTIAA
ncbi:MAG TPA: two-component regulator propeller domain-containing protein, partial [Acetobacteraceae bacterium]|nr:two-component regulator propeller domain-containing protein [Acetobacteraceae bacterium]